MSINITNQRPNSDRLIGRIFTDTELGFYYIIGLMADSTLALINLQTGMRHSHPRSSEDMKLLLAQPHMREVCRDTIRLEINNIPANLPHIPQPIQIAIWHDAADHLTVNRDHISMGCQRFNFYNFNNLMDTIQEYK